MRYACSVCHYGKRWRQSRAADEIGRIAEINAIGEATIARHQLAA
jgi:hypothetical protein